MVVYQTGVASSPLDLLTKLITFITANGWTAQTPASGDVVISHGTIFCGIDATATEWQRRGCTAFNGGAAWNAQTGAAAFTDTLVLGAGPYTSYHFYAGDEDGRDYLHVVVEIAANEFRHWVVGELVKSGTYTGGTYCDSTRSSTTSTNMNTPDTGAHRFICDANVTSSQTGHLWVDYDAKASPNWQACLDAGTSSLANVNGCTGSSRSSGINAGFFATEDMGWNLRTLLLPLWYFVNRASSARSPVGRIPNMRLVNIRNFQPGELVTYGSEQWQVWPVFIRRTEAVGTGILSSGLYGYAHRR